MMPGGEAGLVSAAIGNSRGVFTAAGFSDLALMVLVTTLLSARLLKLAMGHNGSRSPD
jgi:hypothetical protein